MRASEEHIQIAYRASGSTGASAIRAAALVLTYKARQLGQLQIHH